jgi:hypothetical protein
VEAAGRTWGFLGRLSVLAGAQAFFLLFFGFGPGAPAVVRQDWNMCRSGGGGESAARPQVLRFSIRVHGDYEDGCVRALNSP